MYDKIYFDIQQFNFRKIVSNFLNEDLERLHKSYVFEPNFLDMVAGKQEYDIVKQIHKKIITTKTFKSLWRSFILETIKPYFDNEKILYQKTPSLRIFPAYQSVQYVEKITEGFNKHQDRDAPFFHPEFETNFWIPLTECDHKNDLYFQDGDWFRRVDVRTNQIFVFDKNTIHGNRVHNESFNTRCSLDFKALKLKDYDPSILSDKLITKIGKKYKQKEWYSTQYYYDEL